MNKIFRNSLLMLAAGTFVASCADYNDLGGFKADPDPTYEMPYADLNPVKTYIDKANYPNMSIDASIQLKEFNKQALNHTAAITNFEGVDFGYSFMPADYVSKKGYMNFMDLKEALNHISEIGANVYGCPIVSSDKQADDWFSTLTAPIEVQVLPVDDKEVDYSTATEFTGHADRGKPTIEVNYDDKGNALKIPKRSKVNIIEDFDIDPLGYYTVTFTVKSDYSKEENINCTFSGTKVMSGKEARKYTIRPNAWQTIKVEAAPAEGVTKGYLMIEGNLNAVLYVRNVKVSHTPDNHRDQTAEEIKDTITYAINKWCDGLMEANAGRIKSFDLIDRPLDTKSLEENPDIFDLKHATDKILWQDIFGSEEYAPVVSKAASAAFAKHGGDLAELKFFINETGLENQKKFESLKYWMNIWEAKGAKIDGINAELNLSYSEDEATQTENETTLNTLLENLASTGKLVRLYNFDIKYYDADGATVSATSITSEQRQKLADYYAKVIKAYMTKIPSNQQVGISKGSLYDTSDPVGLWTKDWVRNATYEAFCKALSGK
ncbi:Glycosyl hydrolase family 10 [Prevotellaceae bacterium HUN156]|nr:Glycosyl hydrolase family 10 [Prevotellaceae bacterium HUN156]